MRTIACMGAIFLAVLFAYVPLSSAPALTWDDGSNIFNNPFFTMHMWWGVWTDVYYGLYVPVTSTVWAFLYWLGGGDPVWFRGLNLFLHIFNIALTFRLLHALAERWRLNAYYAVPLATALFALHPLQVETVAWISGGRDLLASFFALSATAIYYAYPSRKGYWASTLIFVLGLLSKPSVTILPLAILFLDAFLGERALGKSFMRMSAWFAFAFAAIFLTVVAQADHFENLIPFYQRPFVVLDNLAFYAGKLIWPFGLSGNYAYTPECAIGEGYLKPTAVALVLAGFIVAAKKCDRRYLIGVLAFILLLPVSGVIAFGYEQISGVADHYLYLPLAALSAVALLAWAKLEKNKVLLTIPLTLALFWAGISVARAQIWKNDLTFFSDMAKTSPDSYSTALGMSVVMCEDAKNYIEGLKWIDRALKARNDDILALANRAFCLLNANRNQEVIAMDLYLERLNHAEMSATQPTAYSSLISSVGTAMIKEGDLGMGYQYLCEAYRILPSEPNHANNLKAAGEILQQHGITPKCAQSLEDVQEPEEENQ